MWRSAANAWWSWPAVQRRDPGPDRAVGGSGGPRRRPGDPRRGVQTAQLALRLPGPREDGLHILREAADRNGLLVVSEVMDLTQVPLVAQYADILQVGARNMQNFNLLRELGRQRKPVLLKRGISATIEELLLSANTFSPAATTT